MEVLAVDGDRVTDYTKIMYNHLKDFEVELKVMISLEGNVVWDSPAGRAGKEKKKKIIEEYLIFANKMMQFVDYLEGYVNGYDELVEEVKDHFKKLNEEFDIKEEEYGKIFKS